MEEMESQLKATFKTSNGENFPFYDKTTKKEIEKQKTRISNIIEKGYSHGLITKNDN